MNKILKLKESGREYYICENEPETENRYTFYNRQGDIYHDAGLLIATNAKGHVDIIERAIPTELTLQQWVVGNRLLDEEKSLQLEPIRLAIEERGEVFNLEKRYYAQLGKKYYQAYGRGKWQEVKKEVYRSARQSYDRHIKNITNNYRTYFRPGSTARTSIDALRALMRYIAYVDPTAQPPMSTTYKLSFHDCDGRTSISIRLDSPLSDKDWEVKNAIYFCYNAPVGYLSNHVRL